MTRLSVNINKIAVLRNSRGGDVPDVLQAARDCEKYGAEGITVHPRPDERHIRYRDVEELADVVTTEFNIEGNPTRKWMKLVMQVKPAQATLVPDAPGVLTSDAGWDTQTHFDELVAIVQELKEGGIRVSVFIDPMEHMVEGARAAGADRIELYTGRYARHYEKNRKEAIMMFIRCSELASELGLGVNAGHDLNLENLHYLKTNLPRLDEVSIGHALISDALHFGLEKTIGKYRALLT